MDLTALKPERVLVVCAHPDDEVFGVGGTLAKYVGEKKRVTVVVFSYGELSHVWLKQEYTAKMREDEHEEAKKVIGFQRSEILGLTEGKFIDGKAHAKDVIKAIISDEEPDKIFTHSRIDPHPDHKQVNQIVMECSKDVDYKGEIYGFDVWNPINFRRITSPMLYVDISKTFKTKLDALGCFRSQWSSMIALLWNVYLSAIMHGLSMRVRFAERFYREK